MFALCLSAWFALSAHAASFDCAKAGAKVEHIICDTPKISRLDEELAQSYKAALEDQAKADEIKQAQKKWMKERNACADAACIKRAYEIRLTSLATTSATNVTARDMTTRSLGSWTYRGLSGRNEQLCHKLLSRLNRYDRDESLENRCSFPVLASYPKFTAPPWEELDVEKHRELFFKLTKYSGEGGPDGYFHLVPGLKQRNPDSHYRYLTKLDIESGARMRVWRTRLFGHYRSDPPIPAPPGEQAVVQIYLPMPKGMQPTYCVGKPKPSNLNMYTLLFIVTPDLAGPDPNVDPGTFGISGGKDLLIYEGKPILVGSTEDVWRDGEFMPDRMCDFEFVQGE
mgnify:CR=1 FL=1